MRDVRDGAFVLTSSDGTPHLYIEPGYAGLVGPLGAGALVDSDLQNSTDTMARSAPLGTLAIIALVVSMPRAAHSQQDTTRVRAPLEATRQPLDAAPQPAVLLDRPVGRTDYLLGPGDVVQVSIVGELNRSHQLRVSPEGSIVVPAMGIVRVGGQNLTSAEQDVRSLAGRYYRNVAVHLSLIEVRQFKVFVAGQVPNPGVRVASAVTRVSEIIDPEAETSTMLSVRRYRNVEVRRSDGQAVRADLVRFRQLGDMSANPVVSDGDVILVPPMAARVEVHGRVFFPGTYEYVAGETLAELLRLASGGSGSPADAADSVRIARGPRTGSYHIIAMSLRDAVGAPGAAFPLEAFDVITVAGQGDFARSRLAWVTGQVANPGQYPITPGVTTLRHLVELAGGLLPDAALTSASLNRCVDGEDPVHALRGIPEELLSNYERRLLSAADGGRGSRCNVTTDFESLFAGRTALDQPIQPGDSVSIPRVRTEVMVVGAVRRPGAVLYVPALAPTEYVRLAGGYAQRADRSGAVVFKAGTGDRVDLNEVRTLTPGDMVVVPYAERRNLSQVIQTVSSVVATVTTIVLTWVAVTQ